MIMRLIALVLSLITLAAPALADSIDGDWCLAQQHITVKGPEITLPTGATIQGQYRRHEFLYQVPAPDPDAGQLRYLQLQGEDIMSLYHVKDGKAVDGATWLRCKADATS
jgi:hypothetical protein